MVSISVDEFTSKELSDFAYIIKESYDHYFNDFEMLSPPLTDKILNFIEKMRETSKDLRKEEIV